MTDYTEILDMLQELQKQVETITDAVGRLQAEAEPTIEEPAAAAVMPPTAPAIEIVGGEETEQYPDCCAVGNDYEFYCSGTLIAPRVVVTADHCEGVTRVFLRGNDVSKPEDGEIIPVVEQFTHSEVDLRVLVLERDAAVVPRHVAQGNESLGAERATLVGFGTIDLGGTVGYGIKRKVGVPITSLDCSDPEHPKRYGCLPGREIVAGHRGLQLDSCRGDSGGPLYIESGNGEYYLLGATSRGQREGFTVCGDGGIYVRVDLCLDWIREVTGVNIEGPRV